MEEASHHVVGDRNRAQRGVHGSALERGAGRRPDQQLGGASESGSVDAIVDGGTATPNGTTTSEAKWVQRDELAELELSPFAHAQFVALGWLRHWAADADSGA